MLLRPAWLLSGEPCLLPCLRERFRMFSLASHDLRLRGDISRGCPGRGKGDSAPGACSKPWGEGARPERAGMVCACTKGAGVTGGEALCRG